MFFKKSIECFDRRLTQIELDSGKQLRTLNEMKTDLRSVTESLKSLGVQANLMYNSMIQNGKMFPFVCEKCKGEFTSLKETKVCRNCKDKAMMNGVWHD